MFYASYSSSDEVDVSILKGLILSRIERSDDQIDFETVCGRKFTMYHTQDCCESVYIDSVVGDLQDLVGSPILLSECVASDKLPPKDRWDDSYTWTFYKFATIKGYVDIRWYGSSNGYYSESVDFLEIKGSN